ncbi:Moulting cycle MLT-10-like protein family-containing protein [Strongyloides ratti]|uniref:Moulting cycle MLT-10-like protein family-containing protein n=1 Tax=Strongyloides ratti TaxID=34506 RepID=A0A090MPU5_STRRB|nr:Moulting cycle MLT-10-like protein family-containing protein [Strongyloides ratti]CEF60157.1 Moulting cycle MLT-10-like protein family-containing protein [Strongyloides ratti]
MKTKAEQLLSILPVKEKIIYNVCMNDAKKLSDAAKCIVSLINVRDRLKLINKSTKDNNINNMNKKLKNYINKINNKLKLKKVIIKVKKKNEHINNKYFFSNKYFETNNIIVQRPKRDLMKSMDNSLNLPNHLKNVVRLERYQEMRDYVKKYFDRITAENTKTLGKYCNPLITKTITDTEDPNKKISNTLDNIINLLNEFITSSKKFIFLSPKLFNIFPSCKVEKCDSSKKFLSPTLLSFYENDGLFSLPSLIKSSLSNNIEVNNWLNFLLEHTGGGKKLSKVMEEMEPKINEMEEIIYPNVLKMAELEQKNKKIYETFNKNQKYEINYYGYTFLSSDQMLFKYNSSGLSPTYYNMLTQMSREDHERRLEENLKELALNDFVFYNKSTIKSKNYLLNRFSRAANNSVNDPLDDYEGHHHSGFFNVFKPSAFLNVVGAPVIFETIVLSPHAFIGEILNPEFGMVNILSPRAFVATILSPNALFSRILQPGFFKTEILTPRALNSWILSPDMFIIDVLSPKMLEAKILSPELFVIKILSPKLLTANVASSENFAIVVLSPSILSPTIYGKDSMVVEILSPHLLSGSHESEENEHDKKKEEEEVNNTTTKMYI